PTAAVAPDVLHIAIDVDVGEVLLAIEDRSKRASRCRRRSRSWYDVFPGDRRPARGELLQVPIAAFVPGILQFGTGIAVGEMLLIVVDGNKQAAADRIRDERNGDITGCVPTQPLLRGPRAVGIAPHRAHTTDAGVEKLHHTA